MPLRAAAIASAHLPSRPRFVQSRSAANAFCASWNAFETAPAA